MIKYAVFVFAVAAAGGLVLAFSIFRARFASWYLSVLHAGLGATGLVLLTVAALGGAGGNLALAALVTLIVAALGGFYLAYQHWHKQLPPRAIVALHASVAVIGFGLLVAAAIGV